jgi:molybdopterin-guanine dinucleotide biosynthesis protein A
MLTGLILAGGRSSRMGQDKAGLILPDGRTLLERQAAVLRSAGVDTVIASVQRGTRGLPVGLAAVYDAVPGAGPLAGLAAGLRAVPAGRVMVLAVDMPGISVAQLVELLDLSTEECGAVPTLGGKIEPLVGIYPSALAASCQAALNGERRAVHEWVREEAINLRLRLWEVPVTWTDALRSWNTPEDLPKPPS